MADYAFIIGLENYIASGLTSVKYAENDANAIAVALKELGFIVDCVLLSTAATKTSIEHKLKQLFESLGSDDRFLFYYAGHGWAIPGHTLLTCADTSKADMDATGIRLSWIMDRFDESECNRAMFFLDACHTGAVNLKSERGILDHMDEKEVRAFFDAAEHKVCFASCKFSQQSTSANALKHGVWTYQILKALRGEEAKALTKSKYLTANSLQDFLRNTVPIVIKTVRSDDFKQTPVMYGSLTNDFEIADLSPLIETKKTSGQTNPAFKSAVYSFSENMQVRKLSGFRSHHKIPKENSEYHSNWITSIAKEDVKERVDARFQEIKTALGLKRREIDVVDDRIVTKDFEYAVWCEQDSDSAGEAVFHEELSSVSPEILLDTDLNELFDNTFDEMVLSPSKKIDVNALIDTIEDLDDPNLTVDFKPGDSSCIVTIVYTKVDLVISPTSVRVITRVKTNPEGLVNAFMNSRQKMMELAGPTVRLLN